MDFPVQARLFRFICACAVALCLAAPVSAQLRAGVGKADITPDQTASPAAAAWKTALLQACAG
jgi:hypothetical protein